MAFFEHFQDVFCYLALPFTTLYFMLEIPESHVEERFIMNTAYDVAYGTPLREFHHLEFPHVVPRTIIPSFIYGYLAKPLIMLGWKDPVIHLIFRALLGLLGNWSLFYIAQKARAKYGANSARLFLLLCAVQYKLVFNISRTYPNILAQNILTFMWGSILIGEYLTAVKIICYVAIIIRSEVVIFLLPLCLGYLFWYKRDFKELLVTGIKHCFFAVFITVAADSHFWRSWGLLVWPELTAFIFNVIDGNSVGWGQSLYWFYFEKISGLLQLEGYWYAVVILLVAALIRHKETILFPFICGLTYIGLYSILPHKEERFITYTVPMLNLILALGATTITDWLSKRFLFSKLLIYGALIPLALILMLVQAEEMLQLRAGLFVGSHAIKRATSIKVKENITIIVNDGCHHFGNNYWTVPTHDPMRKIKLLDDKSDFHIKEGSWINYLFGDNCRNCPVNETMRNYNNYDMFITNIWVHPNEEIWKLVDRVYAKEVTTSNILSRFRFSPAKRLEKDVYWMSIFVKKESLHKFTF